MKKRIITISREFGSGGRFIGEEVAKKLGIAYYDKNIINDIAEKSGLSPEYVQKNAELSPKKGLFAYVIPCYYMFICVPCQVFFNEFTIFFYTEMAVPDHPWNSHHSPIQNVPLPP